MNERFNELYQKSFRIYQVGVGFDVKNVERFDLEKFAELIVRECANIADEAEPYKSTDLILKHFGIKE